MFDAQSNGTTGKIISKENSEVSTDEQNKAVTMRIENEIALQEEKRFEEVCKHFDAHDPYLYYY